jgi:glycosyltransferase involved in cell wall biosynthesis
MVDDLTPVGRGDRLRVVIVGKGPPDRGGIPTFIETLLRSPLTDRHDVSFLNVAHHEVPEGGKATWGNVRRTLADARAVRRAAKDADVVHVQSALAPTVTVLRASVLGLSARLAGAHVIVHAHGGNIDTWLRGRWRRALLRRCMAPASLVVAVWTAGETALRDVLDPAQVRLVDNGVHLADFAPGTGSRVVPRVLYVGLLTPRKGVVDLLSASRTVAARGVEHELWLVGGTPDEGPEAEAAVRDAATDDHVRLLSSRPAEEIAGAYAEADVFCLPSWWEAMPLSVLEAMACALPVVASDVGDVHRAVLDGDTGFVVPARSPEPLAAALEKLLTDPELRSAMGRAGREHVTARFSSTATADAVDALYRELGRRRR